MEDAIQAIRGPCLLAGDFNARAREWGMPHTDTRGRLLLEMASRLGLLTMNEGDTPTYRRPGFGESIPDVTLASEGLASRIVGWRVMGDYSGSDHEYITFELTERRQGQRSNNQRPLGWNLARLDERRLTEALLSDVGAIPQTEENQPSRADAEMVVEATSRLIHRACDASMPRKKARTGKRPVYWWTDHIAELRRNCLRLRRRAQRSRDRPEAVERSGQYRAAKRELVKAIRQSKARCWSALCEDVNSDPWGQGYKLVMKKLAQGPGYVPMEAEKMRVIVDGLFPDHRLRDDAPLRVIAEEIPLFTQQELERAVSSMKNKKAPGPDSVPSEVLKLVAKYRPQLLLNMYNVCLKAGVFASRWKQAKLVLLSKKRGPPDAPSSYRPLCMLDTAGKLMERLLKPRIGEAVRAAGDLSARQHGFRKGHSTLSAISEVVNSVTRANQACHAARPIVLLVTLDVKNAFNSARWCDILDALERTFRLPGYLLAMVRDYLRDRRLMYETDQGLVTRTITSGAAQGSVLGPDLWNVSYDSLLRTQMPYGTFLVGYADDVAAVITKRDAELAQWRLNQVMRLVEGWMRDHGLQLALSKTEIVMLTRRRVPTIIPMRVGAEVIETQRTARYLGVVLDNKLTYWDHIRGVCDKAAEVTSYLGRLMANIGGPSQGKRRLLLSTAQAVMLYGAEIWADATKVKKYRTRMLAVQRRGALRVASSYRTVSQAAVLVIAGAIPIDLLAQEKKTIWVRAPEMDWEEAAKLARGQTMGAWQRRWDEDTTGRWTWRLIRDLEPWVCRDHGEVNFYLTQFLTGHGYFRLYLHRMGKVDSPRCRYCGHDGDDAHHTFFVCSRFGEERVALANSVGGHLTPDNIVGKMLQGSDSWNAVAEFVLSVLRQKRRDGCLE